MEWTAAVKDDVTLEEGSKCIIERNMRNVGIYKNSRNLNVAAACPVFVIVPERRILTSLQRQEDFLLLRLQAPVLRLLK